MLNLFLTIALTSVLYLLFRLFSKTGVHLFQAVVINYVTCVITGIFFSTNAVPFPSGEQMWLVPAIIMGTMFLGTFYLIGYTVKKVNVAVTAIAGKMSLIIPFTVNALYLQESFQFSLWQLSSLLLALIAIVLSAWPAEKSKSFDMMWILLPMSIFLLGGIIDTGLNYVNMHLLRVDEQEIFPVYTFASAAIAGLIIMIFKREKIALKSIVSGIALGIPNYFSIYFLLRSLSDYNNNGAIIFPIMNTAVIVVSALSAWILFRDALKPINIAGVLLALVSLLMFLW